MSTWSLNKTFLRVLPTRWRRKPAGIDMERNYVTVNLCIAVWNKPRCYGNSHAIWDHIVLPATRQRCHSRQEDNSNTIISLCGSYYISPALNTHMTVSQCTVLEYCMSDTVNTWTQHIDLHAIITFTPTATSITHHKTTGSLHTVTQKKYKIFHDDTWLGVVGPDDLITNFLLNLIVKYGPPLVHTTV